MRNPVTSANQGPVNSWINHLLDNQPTSTWFNTPDVSNAIPVNLIESEELFEIELVAPGFQKEDFKINIDGGRLNIGAQIDVKNSNDIYIKKEYEKDSFEKVFKVPKSVDTERIEAKYENGILGLKLWKKPELVPQPPKSIKIQ